MVQLVWPSGSTSIPSFKALGIRGASKRQHIGVAAADRFGDWTVVYNYSPDGRSDPKDERFNFKFDPFENENLAMQHPEKMEQMIAAMARQLEAENTCYPVDSVGNELKPFIP